MKAQVKSSLLFKPTKPELLCTVKNKKTNCTELLWHHSLCKDEHCNMQSGTFTIIQNLRHPNFTELGNPKVSKTLKMHLYQNCICTKPDINIHFTYEKSCMHQITSSSVTVKNC